jgi:predicted GNAT family acetyltransferase
VDTSAVVPLSAADLDEVRAFYAASYPTGWFDPTMLARGHYVGIRQDGQLVSAGGLHVFSTTYRVAALGSIATHPDWRGHGFASAVTARLCAVVRPHVDHIGLNVRADNDAAVACYQSLGLRPAAAYEEAMLTLVK